VKTELVRAAAWVLSINLAALALCFAPGWADAGAVILAFASGVAMSFPAVLLGTKLTATEGEPVAVAALVALGGSMLIWTIALSVVGVLLRNH
jgi:hypothetical protein